MSKSSHAVVVLPAGTAGAVADRSQRRWLAKARLRRVDFREEPLKLVLSVLDVPAPRDGLAALRWWGQTGRRPARWICAADPVYLEARLDHLCLFALTDVAEDEVDTLVAHLQERLADRHYAFSRVGTCGYLERDDRMATAAVSASTAHGAPPDRFLPEGPAAIPHDRLQSELQMCLHDIELNRVREQTGRPPVNSLWFWGGGTVPRCTARSLPKLFTDDPLFRGYWLSASADSGPWPGSLRACAESSSGAFVAVAPLSAGDDAGVSRYLAELRPLLARSRLRRLTLLFRDGLLADVRRRDALRFWRRESDLPEAPGRQ